MTRRVILRSLGEGGLIKHEGRGRIAAPFVSAAVVLNPLSDSGDEDSYLDVRTKVRKGWCDMNKIIKTFAVIAAGMVLTTGTAVAAPHHGWGRRSHCPPPPPRHHVVHHVHHDSDAGWVALGAAAIGAVVGGLIGAAAN